MALSWSAAQLLFDPEDIAEHRIEMVPDSLNSPRRTDDKGDSLWKTFNRVQENATRGGIRYYRQDDKNGGYRSGDPDVRHSFAKARTRQIKSIDRDIRLNQALWVLAERMLEIKTKSA